MNERQHEAQMDVLWRILDALERIEAKLPVQPADGVAPDGAGEVGDA